MKRKYYNPYKISRNKHHYKPTMPSRDKSAIYALITKSNDQTVPEIPPNTSEVCTTKSEPIIELWKKKLVGSPLYNTFSSSLDSFKHSYFNGPTNTNLKRYRKFSNLTALEYRNSVVIKQCEISNLQENVIQHECSIDRGGKILEANTAWSPEHVQSDSSINLTPTSETNLLEQPLANDFQCMEKNITTKIKLPIEPQTYTFGYEHSDAGINTKHPLAVTKPTPQLLHRDLEIPPNIPTKKSYLPFTFPQVMKLWVQDMKSDSQWPLSDLFETAHNDLHGHPYSMTACPCCFAEDLFNLITGSTVVEKNEIQQSLLFTKWKPSLNEAENRGKEVLSCHIKSEDREIVNQYWLSSFVEGQDTIKNGKLQNHFRNFKKVPIKQNTKKVNHYLDKPNEMMLNNVLKEFEDLTVEDRNYRLGRKKINQLLDKPNEIISNEPKELENLMVEEENHRSRKKMNKLLDKANEIMSNVLKELDIFIVEEQNYIRGQQKINQIFEKPNKMMSNVLKELENLMVEMQNHRLGRNKINPLIDHKPNKMTLNVLKELENVMVEEENHRRGRKKINQLLDKANKIMSNVLIELDIFIVEEQNHKRGQQKINQFFEKPNKMMSNVIKELENLMVGMGNHISGRKKFNQLFYKLFEIMSMVLQELENIMVEEQNHRKSRKKINQLLDEVNEIILNELKELEDLMVKEQNHRSARKETVRDLVLPKHPTESHTWSETANVFNEKKEDQAEELILMKPLITGSTDNPTFSHNLKQEQQVQSDIDY